jgi:peptidylprolyl isomerase
MRMRYAWPLLAVVLFGLVGCEGNPNPFHGDKKPLKELEITDEVVGTGPVAEAGDLVTVRYTGRFGNGEVFDSNMAEDKDLYIFGLAGQQVIPGWDEGVAGMKVGGIRKLGIPWVKAYGEQGSDSIPPKADLWFEIKLIDVVKPHEQELLPIQIEKEGTGPEAKSGDIVMIDYEARLADNKLVDRQKDQQFQIDEAQAIPGLNAAVKGMKVGEVRNVTVPPQSAFGMDQRGPIPGGAKLLLKVTLKGIKKPQS